MRPMTPQPSRFGVKHTLLALALMTAYASASALPVFTLNPGAVGLTGDTFTANNIIISNFSTVTGTSSFTDSGYLSVAKFQDNDGTYLSPTGLNDTYGLYVEFHGAGTQQALPGGGSSGSFTSLGYTLYGYSGPAASFSGFDTASGTGTIDLHGATPIALASGHLIAGSVVTSATGAPSADARLSFDIVPAASGFFTSPTPFYNMALTSFSNTISEVVPFDGGFKLNKGGGSINFVSAVPEPETYALMLAGLGAVGWISRRRKKI